MLTSKLAKLASLYRLRTSIYRHVREILSEEEWRGQQGPFLPQEPVETILATASGVQLVQPRCNNGNVSATELLVIAALVARRSPQVCFEVGTFDGNTTLQLAANSAKDGLVLTLDLPVDTPLPRQIAEGDGQFIKSVVREQRRYRDTAWARKIIELFGDSMTFDFKAAVGDTFLDLAFVDGSHSYEYVKNDTERLLPCLAKDGVLIWHDYCRSWPGVVSYLNQLGRSLPLKHVAGTSIVYLERNNSPSFERA